MKYIYKNPIVVERADPWVYKHTDNYYYFTGSVPGYQSIEIRRSKTLNGLQNGEVKTIWHAHETGIQSQLIWAPEIHYLNNKWYIYYAASDSKTERNLKHYHKMFVLECEAENPFTGQWVEKGQIKTHINSFSIDGTVFTHKNELYYVWAQLDPNIEGNSNLYISKMANPWTLKGPVTMLTKPEYAWEKIGFMVNEGAAVIIKNEKVFITFSGSATDHNYAMGLLWAHINDDLIDEKSWHKLKDPVFKSSEENQQYGPGHNSFTKTEDDQMDVLIYHARPTTVSLGDPLDNPNRHARAQVFTWDKDGFPVFGKPVK